MPTLTAVAANLVQAPASGGSASTAATNQPTESFSSHLQAASEKQVRPQNSENAAKDVNDSTQQESTKATNENSPSASKDKAPYHRNDNESTTDTAENQQVADNQSATTEYVNFTQASPQQSQGESVKEINSETTGKESVVGQMLSAISNAQAQKTPAHHPTLIASKALETAQAATMAAQGLPLKAQPAVDQKAQDTMGAQGLPLQMQPAVDQKAQMPQINLSQQLGADITPLTAQKQTLPGPNMQIAQGSLESGIQAAAGATIIFNPNDGSITMANQESQQGQLAVDGQDEVNGPLLVQNKFGQIITIEQSKESTVSPMVTTSVAGQQIAHQESNNLDFTGRYIHSHLPNKTEGMAATQTGNAAMNSDQSQSSLFGGGNQDIHTMQAGNQTGGMQEATPLSATTSPLSFSYHMNNVQNSITGTIITPTGESAYQLSSGSYVPDSTVVDQITAHFSVNNRLETSSVNLKLNPQELGELRMEIKVEHDNVKAHIVAQSPHAQEMIDRHVSRLREALEQQGLHLNEIEVTVADNDNAAGERFENNEAWQQSQQSTHRKNMQTDFTLEQDDEVAGADELNDNFKAIA